MNKVIEKYKNCIILFLTIVVHTIVLYLMCDFSKTLETYGDELVYYSIAKSIFYGKGIQVQGVDFPLQNIAFSLYLVPFNLIADSTIRIHVITLCNALLMSLCIIPVWLICKELKVKKKYMWYMMIIICVWPDMINAGTIMSENLYWILSLSALYLCIKTFNSENLWWAGIAAIFSYMAYFCKEVAICIPLAYFAVTLVYPLFSVFFCENDARATMKDAYTKDRCLIKLMVYIASYVVIYIVFKYGIYGNTPNFYANQMGFDFVKNPYSLYYFFYGFFYYILTALIAFFVIPVVYPVMNIKKLDKITQKSYFFSLILLVGTLLVIVYTITVKEDLGRVAPRIHLRYFSSMIGIFLPIFFKSLELVESDYEHIKNNRIKDFLCYGMIVVICLLGYRGVHGGCLNENLALSYSQYLASKYSQLCSDAEQTVIFYPSAIIVAAMILIFTVLFCLFIYIKSLRKFLVEYILLVIVLVCSVNTFLGYKNLRNIYAGNASAIDEMAKINNYFKANNIIDNDVMYVTTGWWTKEAKIYDTYFDGQNSYEIGIGELADLVYLGGGSDINISSTQFDDVIWGKPYFINNIDFFIVGKDAYNIISIVDGIEEINEISGENFKVYQNVDASLINSKTDSINVTDLKYIFMKDGYNVNLYNIDGISGCEGAYSWTDGNKLNISGHISSGIDVANVVFYVENTFGDQEVIVYQGDNIIFDEVVSGKQKFDFNIHPINGDCSFGVYFPNAKSPLELGQSEDSRKLALAIKSINITGIK